ncbi:hypothetical protein B0H14DRAFT_3711113 [Mycena olivaceomarginata]|nr:hypothetical protein B0H14DRAFT_3711113 [Mycena olivaceomarginata]
MFSGSSGHHVYGGNFYDVSGDVNLHLHNHPQQALEGPNVQLQLEDTPHDKNYPVKDKNDLARAARSGRPSLSRSNLGDDLYPIPLEFRNRGCPVLDERYGTAPGGTIITTENVNHFHGEQLGRAMDILHRAVALEALHDSAESYPQPRCHPETRTKMLNNLFSWATGSSSVNPVCWLHGPAGAGKSAVMQSLCRRLAEENRLAGSFFFRRGHPTSGNAKMLFATLAYQLVVRDSQLKDLILRQVFDDPSVVGRDLEVQLQALIVGPCVSWKGSRPLIFLVDGLDECDGEAAQRQTLHLIAGAVAKLPSTLRILVASRPEPHIRATFASLQFTRILKEINVQQSFDDVRTYLRDEFSRIRREHTETMARFPLFWPSNYDLEALVDKSSGYFIYASTVIKFIDDPYSCPIEQLDIIRKLPKDLGTDRPFAALDQLYTQILSRVPARFRARLLDILCVNSEHARLQLHEIEYLLGLEPGDVALTCRALHSLLDLDRNGIRTYHASFGDYLRDPDRSLSFHVGQKQCINVACSIFKAFSYDPARPEERGYNAVRFLYEYTLHFRWLDWVISLPPSAEIVSGLRAFNMDWLWLRVGAWSRESQSWITESVAAWLGKIQPSPTHLVSLWDDVAFLSLCDAILYPTLLIQARETKDTSFLADGPSAKILSQSPQLRTILSAKLILRVDPIVGFHAIRDLGGHAQGYRLLEVFDGASLRAAESISV